MFFHAHGVTPTKQLHKENVYRTVDNTLENNLTWHEAGGKKPEAKNYKNWIHHPIFLAKNDNIS